MAKRNGITIYRQADAPDLAETSYMVSGAAVLGNQVLGAGDGFFVPGGAPYQYRAGLAAPASR